MMQRALRPALSMVTAVAMTACGQAASVGVQKAGENGSVAPGVTSAQVRVAEATGEEPFPAMPGGYRGLGGAFMIQGKLVVVAPNTSAPMQGHDRDIGLSHGIVAGHARSLPMQADACGGLGTTPESPIVVSGLADPADEVEAGIACAKLRHPGAHWTMSQLITRGHGYLAQVTLEGGNGEVIVVYTDVNRFADMLIAELDG
jgi:hypothetical protein